MLARQPKVRGCSHRKGANVLLRTFRPKNKPASKARVPLRSRNLRAACAGIKSSAAMRWFSHQNSISGIHYGPRLNTQYQLTSPHQFQLI
jgi:hypothetical protein